MIHTIQEWCVNCDIPNKMGDFRHKRCRACLLDLCYSFVGKTPKPLNYEGDLK